MRRIQVGGHYKDAKPPKWALIDDEDYKNISKWRWSLTGTGDAQRYDKHKRIHIKMHREIMGAQTGKFVDHIDHNRLNNQRSNLRTCTPSQNSRNKMLPKNNTSGFAGVHFGSGKWVAKITKNGKTKHLGVFITKEQAASARFEAEKDVFGEYALRYD